MSCQQCHLERRSLPSKSKSIRVNQRRPVDIAEAEFRVSLAGATLLLCRRHTDALSRKVKKNKQEAELRVEVLDPGKHSKQVSRRGKKDSSPSPEAPMRGMYLVPGSSG